MPQDWSSDLDTQAIFDAVGDFSGGQVSYAKPRLLKPNQSSLLQNCEIAVTGQVSTRFGTAYIGSSVSAAKVEGLFYMNNASNSLNVSQEIMWPNNSGLVYKLSGGVWTSTTQTITIGDIPSIVQGANLVYFAGGNTSGNTMYKWDGTTFTAIDSDTDSGGVTGGPRFASILIWHMNRLVAAGKNIKSTSGGVTFPDAIFFSDILNASNWGATKAANQLRVGAGDGQAITALVPWQQFNIAAFKRSSIWVVSADPTLSVSDMPIQLVHGTVGCVARKTACQVGADIFFLADDGIRSLSQVIGSESRQELSLPLSYPVQDYINRINVGSVSNACAIYWRNLYIIALPLDSSTTNNYILVYNTLTKSWAGVWTNLPVNVFATRLVSSVPRLMMGFATNDRVVEYNDYVLPANWVTATFQDYDASAVQPRIQTKSYLFDDPLAIKVAKGGEIEWNNSDGTLSVTPIVDEATQTVVEPNPIAVASGGFLLPTGSTAATGTVTASGVPADGNTVTINGRTYTFKTTLGSANDQIHINGQDGSLTNLAAAINGTGSPGVDYTGGTLVNGDVTSSAVAAHAITLTSRYGGTGANSITLAKVGANLAVSGATLTGGTGGFTFALAISFVGLARQRFDLMRYGEFRELQLDVQGLTGSRKEIRQLSVAGFVRPSLVGNS